MSRLQKISSVGAGLVLLFVPFFAAHAQVMGQYGYNTGYYPTTYPTSNQYYDNSYYPTNTYGNGYNNYYPYSYPAPTCTLSITSPTTYSASAVTGTVSWTTANASSAYLSNVGPVNSSGSVSAYMTPYETFTLTISGPGGTSTCQNTYYPTQQQYEYSGYPSYNQPYYQSPTTYYPVPSYNYNTYNPITYVRNWWQRMFH